MTAAFPRLAARRGARARQGAAQAGATGNTRHHGPIDIASVRRKLDWLSDDLDAGRTPDLATIRIA